MVVRGFDDEICSDGGVTGYGSKGGRGVWVVQSGAGPTMKGIVEIGNRINGYLFAIRSDTSTRNASSTLGDEAEGIVYGGESGGCGSG